MTRSGFMNVLALMLVIVSQAGREVGAQPNVRIIGGVEVVPGEFPFLAFVHADSDRCGGSLIDRRHVLTAAHCIISNNELAQRITVGLGCHSLSDCPEEPVEEAIVHPFFRDAEEGFDIAVLRLNRDVELCNQAGLGAIRPISFAKDYADDELLTVVGWGSITSDDKSGATPKKVSVPVVPLNKCRKQYELVDNKQICAGRMGRDSCRGDSGGPLFRQGANGSNTLLGIVSYGYGCGSTHPGVYTRVGAYDSWISASIRN